MQKVLHKAEDRGVAEHDWLHSRFSFSFADWYEPTRLGFGALRVINDDTIDPSSGFPMHPHRDMEIITIVEEGSVTHHDSMGNTGVVRAGEVQVMSAGTGVVHSEYNDSSEAALKLFQIWIFPDAPGYEPRYEQQAFIRPVPNEPQLLVGEWESSAPLTIHQSARITRLRLTSEYAYTCMSEAHGVYILVVRGALRAADEELAERDALGVWEAPSLTLTPLGDAEVLCIEVPMR